jgi:hypothetical protein
MEPTSWLLYNESSLVRRMVNLPGVAVKGTVDDSLFFASRINSTMAEGAGDFRVS